MPRRVGVVLAGGVGSRIGRAKGELEVGGVPLALRAARVIEPLCEEVLISLRNGTANPAPPHRPVWDGLPSGRGPLAGLQAAWQVTAPGSELLVLACDYPRVDRGLMMGLLREPFASADVVLVADTLGRDHPLVALWRWTARASVERALASGTHRVGAVLESVRVARLGARDYPERTLDPLLVNINTKLELERLVDPSRSD